MSHGVGCLEWDSYSCKMQGLMAGELLFALSQDGSCCLGGGKEKPCPFVTLLCKALYYVTLGDLCFLG